MESEIDQTSLLKKFFDSLSTQSHIQIVQEIILKGIDTIINREIEKSKGNNFDAKDRKTILVNYYFSMLEEFIAREKRL